MVTSCREERLYNKFKERMLGCGRCDNLVGNRELIKRLSVLVVHEWGHELPYQISEKCYEQEMAKIDVIGKQIQPGEFENELREALKEADEYIRIIGMYRVRRKCRVY